MIRAQGLTRTFGSLVAVEDISFEVRPGEIMGLLGPNGAGKTTILRMLATEIVPVAGTAVVGGADILKEPYLVRQNLGYLPETALLYGGQEVGEFLNFVAESRGLSPGERQERLAWVAEVCGLKEVWVKPIGELSKGYRQRVGLAQALVHDPPCLVLDEPTSGLDPLQIWELRRLIRTLARQKAIIFSTHILQEIEALADWVTIINQGKIVAQGRFSDLARKASPNWGLRVGLGQKFDLWSELSLKVEYLGLKEDIHWYRIEGPLGLEEKLYHLFCAHGVVPLALRRESEDLEQVFLKLISKGGSDVRV